MELKFSLLSWKMGLIRSGYTNFTPEDDIELIDYLWPVVREIVKTAIENNQNIIVEGCIFLFAQGEGQNKGGLLI